MKKNLLLFAMAIGSIAMAQQTRGKVGIQTENPTETLHVKGSVRIENLPSNGQKAIYTNSNGKGTNTNKQIFKPEKFVAADKNGVLGTMSLGSWGRGPVYNVDATNEYAEVDLSAEKELKAIYVINDASTGGRGFTIDVTLPKNREVDNEARVLRVIIIPTNGGGTQSVNFIGKIGNGDRKGVGHAISFTNGNIGVGGNSDAKYRTIFTFVELSGKWYLDEGVIL